ncbi:tRNA-dependent cyclodipeptide synthase [Streptomyces sp. CdTB01]|uniref:tRNA-dependent cyclodipeptide synthase n=1 Tax=Streptomyces sp. CdTB01 TaxID=1725411 RepID=UPI0007C67B5A|nr:tRNA-dependent cyclodipeptide synthase [Streptomyces sp. CdTB01]
MTANTTAARVDGLVVTPLSTNCAAALARAEHACVGISPFNSYFSVGRIRQIAQWAYRRFARVDFFVPDGPSAYTLQALGYPPERAEWKARRQGQYTRNRINSALRDLGVRDGGSRILGWTELQGDAAFARLHAEGWVLYERDEDFQAACRETSAWVLSGRLPASRRPDENQVDCAVRYFLAELPVFLDTPAIVGADASVFCYHQPPPFLYRLYRSELTCQPAPGQGFVVVTPSAGCPRGSQGKPVPADHPLQADHLGRTPEP